VKPRHLIVTEFCADSPTPFIPCITVGPVKQRPPTNVAFGSCYGRPYRAGGRIVWLFRKGQRVRFFNNRGEQVGAEQRNVAPAVAFAISQGWVQL